MIAPGLEADSVDQQGTRSPFLTAALDCARRGFRVFPVHSVSGGLCTCGRADCESAGKHPRIKDWVNQASVVQTTIREWWAMWPEANIGITTGTGSGVVVLDVDGRHGGGDSLVRLSNEHGNLPLTVEVLTGGGGGHVYFAHPGGSVPNKVSLAPGLDIRGDGGFVVAPPSLHASGNRYAWRQDHSPEALGLAPLPNWLLEMLQSNARTTSGVGVGTDAVIPKGARNNSLFRLGSAMRRHGAPYEAILAGLLEDNRRRCQPPLSDDEVIRIARSAASYEPETGQQADPQGGPHVTIRDWAQILSDPLPPPRMLVDRLFLAGHIGMIAGPSYVGKSTAALGVAVAVASGKDVFNHFPVWEPTPVIYVYAEQGEDLWEKRLQEVVQANGLELKKDLPITLVAGYELRLNQPEHLDILIRLAKERSAGLIVLDPLAALFGVADENDAAEVVRSTRQPLQRLVQETGVTPVVVHHSAKRAQDCEPFSAQELVRGSGDLIAMTGSILGLWFSKQQKAIKALVTGRLNPPPAFRLRPHDLGRAEGPRKPAEVLVDPYDTGIRTLEWAGWWDKPEDSALETLEAVRDLHTASGKPVTLPQIARTTGRHKSTVFRHCKALVERRLLRPGRSGGYLPVDVSSEVSDGGFTGVQPLVVAQA